MQPGFNGNKLEAFNLYRQPASRGDGALLRGRLGVMRRFLFSGNTRIPYLAISLTSEDAKLELRDACRR